LTYPWSDIFTPLRPQILRAAQEYNFTCTACVLPLEDPTKQAQCNFTLSNVSGQAPPDGTTTVTTISYSSGQPVWWPRTAALWTLLPDSVS
jgi:hypothetical protein